MLKNDGSAFEPQAVLLLFEIPRKKRAVVQSIARA